MASQFPKGLDPFDWKDPHLGQLAQAIVNLQKKVGADGSTDADSLDCKLRNASWAKGDAGPQGPKGDTGPQGIQGPKGTNAAAFRAGMVTLVPADKNKPVTFSTPMPSASYRVLFETQSAAQIVAWASAKTAAGFTVNVAGNVNGAVGWVALQDN